MYIKIKFFNYFSDKSKNNESGEDDLDSSDDSESEMEITQIENPVVPPEKIVQSIKRLSVKSSEKPVEPNSPVAKNKKNQNISLGEKIMEAIREEMQDEANKPASLQYIKKFLKGKYKISDNADLLLCLKKLLNDETIFNMTGKNL